MGLGKHYPTNKSNYQEETPGILEKMLKGKKKTFMTMKSG